MTFTISISPPLMEKLAEVFEAYELIPSTFLENFLVNQQPIIRPRLDTVNNGWGIKIYRRRIDIEQQKQMDIGIFKEKALDILIKIINFMQSVPEGIALTVSDAKQDFNSDIYAKLVNPTEYYLRNQPVEWSLSSVARVDWELAGQSNQVNVISELKRDMNALKIRFDINTTFGNVFKQFDSTIISSFLTKAIETLELLINELKSNGKLD